MKNRCDKYIMKCAMCKKNAGIFASRLADGYICKECKRFLPYGLHFKSMESFYIRDMYEKNKEKAEHFDATSNLGDLYLDSIHNMFCISKKQINGNPTNFGNIFHILELTGIGLVCSNVRNTALTGGATRDNIICDIKFIVKTKEVSADYIIKQSVRCSFSYNGNKIEWNEPGEIEVFRKLLAQMLDNICGELTNKVEEMRSLKDKLPDSEKWARGILYLPEKEPLTQEELKKSRNRLIKLFHPDNGFDDSSYSELINRAYKILNDKL